VLNGVVLSRPTTLKMLEAVDGVNLNFVTKYGKYFVKEVVAFVAETGPEAPPTPSLRDCDAPPASASAKHALSSDERGGAGAAATTTPLDSLDEPQRRTSELFLNGHSINDIQVASSLPRDVVLGHLCVALLAGVDFDLTTVLAKDTLTAIVSAARRTNDTSPRADPRPIIALLAHTLPDVDASLVRLALCAHARQNSSSATTSKRMRPS